MENAQGKNTYYEIALDNDRLKRDAEQAENIIRRIGDASKTEASRIESACMSVSGALKKLGAAVPAAELAKDIYGFADRFERSMAEVTAISETVANNLGKFKQGIIEMSTEIPVPADEAAKAFYRIVSAGHDGAAGMEILRVSAKAAVGGITQTVAAAEAITSILNAYKKGAGEAERISDRLFTAARIGKTSINELGHSIRQVIPVAASFGIESEQALAAVATLAKSGTPVAQAVMQVRAAIMAASEQLGDGYFNTYTLQQGLQEVAGRAAGSEAQLQALVPEIEGVNAILGLTGINAKTAASDLDELMNSAGATETAFEKMAGETGSQLTMLKNNLLALIGHVEAQAGLDTGSMIVERAKKEQEELDALLGELQTYEQQRTAVEEAYEKKRRALYESDGQTLKKGVTQGNVDELDRSKTEALNGVDEQFAQRELTYQAWMDKIADMTLEGLENALAQAKAALTEAEKSGAGGTTLAAAKAKITSVEKKVAKARAEDEVSPGKRSIKEWEKLHKALEGAEREFESIGKAVGGVAGEVVGTAGKVLSSTLGMINSIVSLTKFSAESIDTTSQASSKAIQTVEKASAILAIISAAMSIASTIIGLFNNDEKYQKEIEKLQGRIDQLQWELDNADVKRLQANTENALTLVKRMYAETTQEVLELHATSKKYADTIYQFCGRTLYQNEILKGSVEKLAAAYANVEYSADKALGSAKYDEGKEQLKNIAEQQLLIQQQIEKEGAKKKTDPDKIKDWEHQIQELGLKAVGIINGLVEDIVGGSAADMASELGDAFIEAFRAGEDAAKVWGEKVNDIVADIVKRMLVQEFLEKPLGTLFNNYKEKWFDDGTFLGFGAVNDSMVGFAAELNALIAGFQSGMDGLPDELRNLMLSNADSAREVSEKGIATASQESVDELSGRATAIQGHTYSIMESSRLLVANSSLILTHLAGIETNTRQLARLERIENDMGSVKSMVNDIALKGLKLKS